ncbi:ABC transporter substrate-binding protein [Methylobacterium sp. WL69]|uniref:ABC transporter substrate-binding protein n=1 Tax=Methylobacterium sp. WL69 TaxID=2603893 RepID=UPI0011C7F47D|nr:ABC transporter substrate-binding protein [Methylobacterium sp. WL69]TXM74520.1 ABC transporter substrate-binding protein [Methylobacterium sp. WL69]
MTAQRYLCSLVLAAPIALGVPTSVLAQQESCIGNSAAITGPAAFGGQAIRMGAEIAIEEINAKGGVLGKPLRFVQYDDAGAPPRGVDNTRRIALADKCVVILGGYHSTVSVAQVEPVHALGIPFVGVLAANTQAIENGRSPNYMFRVSAKDKWVARFLVEQAAKVSKTGKIAFFYENTGWGNGALPDVKDAVAKAGKQLVATETFNWNDQDMTPQAIRARDAGADVALFWALDREGNQILRSMDKVGYKPTIIGAWGIAGNLGELAGPLANGVEVVQTYSFMGDLDPKGEALWDKIQAKYGLKDPAQIKMGSGVANAYDAVFIVAKAIEKAGAYDWKKVREGLYGVSHDGLVAKYAPAFDASDPERQDAILPRDYKLTVWSDGKLLPIAQTPYGKAN